ncbi:NHLM bacteriocin system secretion protein [Butyrivibrio sp. ob235]|uniref:biotin/lipoyl-binding protein n=1 Tax=Butyrivibrio sp. ob235 TaxID=1761780 RepID=UPI0008CF2FB2|nr:biotin/lipoyl-binding protein [Butyrivibrio sp. ob235]SEL90322.1 NHLM bacteriocin system secretion protein [Butyrivibrio sp. ob235]
MKSVYNKEALNRIAAQDKLDRMIVLVSPAVWVSIFGAFIIIGGLLVWGFFGKLPTSVDTDGIYLNAEGANYIYSQTEGFVVSVNIKDNDVVHKGDIVATVGDEDDIYRIKQLDTRIQYVENMTFDSEMDIVTSDTEQMAQIKLSAKQADQDALSTEAELQLKKEKLKEAQTLANEKEQQMLDFKQQFFATLNVTDQEPQVKYNEASTDYENCSQRYETAKANYISLKETYYSAKEIFDAQYFDFDALEHTEAERNAFEAALADVEAKEAAANDAEYLMQEAEENVETANNELDSARKAYLEYVNSLSETTANNTIASTEYSEVLQDYASAKAAYKALKDEIDELELKSVLAEGDMKVNEENYEQQFNNQKSATLIDLQAQRDSLLNKASKGLIKSNVEGKVYDVSIAEGQGIGVGGKVAALLSGSLDDDIAVCYVRLEDAFKLKPGMSAYIFPSTVDRQEYGHIQGYVESIASHVASQEDLQMQIASEEVVKRFENEGPVVEVRCKMVYDPNSKSGYTWSTNKGNDIELSTGTVISVTIITEEKKPIDLLIPYIKNKLDFREAEDGKQ